MTELRVASYNLHKCRGMTGPFAPERNLRVIAELKPDIIALQEVDFRMGDRPEALPRALIADYTHLVPAPHLGTGRNSLGWHGQTVLLRADLADTARVRRLPLPGLEPRGAIAVTVGTLTVVALHLGLMRSSRRAQLARIAERMPRLVSGDVVVTGDFNEWHDELGTEPLSGLRMVIPGPSWPAPFPRLRYDRFAISRSIELVAAGVADSPIARIASDHLPVWADLRFSPN